jgi:hypothetical protein
VSNNAGEGLLFLRRAYRSVYCGIYRLVNLDLASRTAIQMDFDWSLQKS